MLKISAGVFKLISISSVKSTTDKINSKDIKRIPNIDMVK